MQTANIEPRNCVTVGVRELAELLGVSVGQMRLLHQQHKTPRPLPVTNRLNYRWAKDEIAAWIKAGCPERSAWQKLRERDRRAG